MSASHQHAVKFYATEDSLYNTVCSFLSRGLSDSHVGILIATAAHRSEILQKLRHNKVDVKAAQQDGSLLILDASETLARFMVNGMPEEHAFNESIGAVISDVLERNGTPRTIRAYGEMVDVLWKEGKADAAIRLEMLWNKLAAGHGFSLLCGYAMGNFYKETEQFEAVCRQHTHVMPPDERLTASGAS